MAAPATITIFDNLYDSAGNAIANAPVSCVLNGSAETTVGGLIAPKQQATTTDANGKFSFTVVANDLLSPLNSTYTIITPFRSYDIAPQSANGSPQQTTAANVIVNTPSPLAPATSNLTGPLTVAGLLTAQAGENITGNLAITGNLSVSGTFTPASITVTAGEPGIDTAAAGALLIGDNTATSIELGAVTTAPSLQVTAGDPGIDTVAAGALNLGSTNATSVNIDPPTTIDNTLVANSMQVVAGEPGIDTTAAGALVIGDNNATSIELGAATTVSAGAFAVTAGDATLTAGRLVMGTAVAKIIPGATSISLRNNADSADNLILTDAGLATLRNAVSVAPIAGGTLAPSSYGSLPVKLDEKSGASATYDFQNIPGGYRRIEFEVVLRDSTGTGGVKNTTMTINNDSTVANYSRQSSSMIAASVAAVEEIGGAVWRPILCVGGGSTAGFYSSGVVRMPGYSSAVTTRKTFISESTVPTGMTTGLLPQYHESGVYISGAVAITRVTFTPITGFDANSYIAMWGYP
jgi:hypothetical protein